MICVACNNTKSKDAEAKLDGINLEMFNFVCCLEITETEESQGICNVCVEELNVSFNFKKRCLEIFANVFDNENDHHQNHYPTISDDDKNFIDSLLEQSLGEDDSLNLNDLLIPEVCLGGESHTVLSALDVSDNRKCRYCFQDFSSKEACQNHMEEHRGDDKPYKCPHQGCDSSFKARKNLKDHFLVHSNERPFPCHYCTQTFKSSSNRSKHERRIHATERKAAKQAIASKPINNNNDEQPETTSNTTESPQRPQSSNKPIIKKEVTIVKNDVSIIKKESLEVNDSSDRIFRCEFEGCSSSFKTRSSLKDHQKVHSDERPYGCHYCTSAFKSSSNRSKHERGSHPKEYQKRKAEREAGYNKSTTSTVADGMEMSPPPPKKLKIEVKSPKNIIQYTTPPNAPKQKYQCRYCDRFFNHPEGRDRHEAVHKFFDCGFCSKNFKTQENLKEHMRIHTEQTKFLCPFPTCDVIFQDRRSLREHRLSEHDPEEFICEIEDCGKILPSARALKNHKNHKHPNYSNAESSGGGGGSDLISCDICSQSFNHNEIQEHLKLHI